MGVLQFRDSRILQRAYLAVEPGGIEPYRSGDGRLACNVVFINAGNLPAENVSWFIQRTFSNDSSLNNFVIPSDKTRFSGNNLIPPHGRIIKGGPTIVHTELDGFRSLHSSKPDGCWLYVWGRVCYKDGFNKIRFTDFCHRYNLRGPTTWTIARKHGRQHEHGNRTDKDKA